MTEQENKNETLEQRTASRLQSAKDLMENANEIMNKNFNTNMKTMSDSNKLPTLIYDQNVALYEQNHVIIEYLQAIYKNQSEVKK